MRAGRLRHVITIESKAQTVDSYGDVVKGYTPVYSDIRAEVGQPTGKQLERAGMTANEALRVITLRYVPGITPRHRVVYDGRYMDIESVVNVRERSRSLELVCREQV